MEDVFVPAHRTLPLSALVGGGTRRAARSIPAPLYKLPVLGLFSFVVGGVSLGLARGAIGDYRAADAGAHRRLFRHGGSPISPICS